MTIIEKYYAMNKALNQALAAGGSGVTPARDGSRLAETGRVRQMHEIEEDANLTRIEKILSKDINTRPSIEDVKTIENFLSTANIARGTQELDLINIDVLIPALKALYKVHKEIGYDQLYKVAGYHNRGRVQSFARANGGNVDIGDKCKSPNSVYTQLINSRGRRESQIDNIKYAMREKLKSLPAEDRVIREKAMDEHLKELTNDSHKAFFGNYINKQDPIGSVIVHELGHTILFQKREPEVWKQFYRKAKRTGLTKMVSMYAHTTYQEFFAESLAMYMYDRDLLHPEIKRQVERVLQVKEEEK